MVYLFWLSVGFITYTFGGYPLVLWLVAVIRGRPHSKAPARPTISVIIPAHNEEKQIGQKIQNTLDLAYPPEKREILVASDGSTDGTAAVVRSYTNQGVKLIETAERKGKHFVQMLARDQSHGEVLVFTDASITLEREALEKMASNFADPSVGSVTSEDRILTTEAGPQGEVTFITYDKWIRRLESRVGSTVGLSGSFFAARRQVCDQWNPAQSSDFFLALQTVAKGLRAVVDPECRGLYGLNYAERVEFRRKVRTIVHGLDVFFSYWKLLDPIRFGLYSWQLLSHKLFRWLFPFALFANLLSSLFLWDASWLYRATALGLIGLYGCGLLALLSERAAQIQVLRLAGYFLLGNVATVSAWMKYCGGERYATWNPTRRQ